MKKRIFYHLHAEGTSLVFIVVGHSFPGSFSKLPLWNGRMIFKLLGRFLIIKTLHIGWEFTDNEETDFK